MAKKIDFRGVRERLGENQREFAERFGVNQSTLARWEGGDTGRIPALAHEKLAQIAAEARV